MTTANPLTTVTCPVCDSGKRRELFATKDYKQRITQDQFVVSRCKSCGAGTTLNNSSVPGKIS